MVQQNIRKQTHTPVHYGDMIFFCHSPGREQAGAQKGFLNGSNALKRCGLEQHSLNDAESLPKALEDCLFLICPQFNYKAQEELKAMQQKRSDRRASRADGSQSAASGPGSQTSMNTVAATEIDIEKKRAAQENKTNQGKMEDLMSGKMSETVRNHLLFAGEFAAVDDLPCCIAALW